MTENINMTNGRKTINNEGEVSKKKVHASAGQNLHQ